MSKSLDTLIFGIRKVFRAGVEQPTPQSLSLSENFDVTPGKDADGRDTLLLDVIGGGGGSSFPLGADVSAAGHQIGDLGTPTDPDHAATKDYVDTTVESVVEAAISGIAPGVSIVKADACCTTTNDTHSGLTARDGVALDDGMIVLDPYAAVAANRGRFVAHAGAWTRAPDHDSDADVLAANGVPVYVKNGTLEGGHTWQQVAGTTLAGAKTYRQIYGDPDVVVSENGTIVEINLDEGTGTSTLRHGMRTRKDRAATTIAAGATVVIWEFDGAAIGLAAGAGEFLAPIVRVQWSTDSKGAVVTRQALVLHGSPPVIQRKFQQTTRDSDSLDGTAWLVLDWGLAGNVVQLTLQNNRATACTCWVLVPYGAGDLA